MAATPESFQMKKCQLIATVAICTLIIGRRVKLHPLRIKKKKMWRLTCHQFLEYSSCGSRSSFVLIFIKKIEFDKVNLAENCLSKLILIKSAFQTLTEFKKKIKLSDDLD